MVVGWLAQHQGEEFDREFQAWVEDAFEISGWYYVFVVITVVVVGYLVLKIIR